MRVHAHNLFRSGLFPERTFSGEDFFQSGLFPERTFSGSDFFRSGLFPERTFSGTDFFRNGLFRSGLFPDLNLIIFVCPHSTYTLAEKSESSSARLPQSLAQHCSVSLFDAPILRHSAPNRRVGVALFPWWVVMMNYPCFNEINMHEPTYTKQKHILFFFCVHEKQRGIFYYPLLNIPHTENNAHKNRNDELEKESCNAFPH